jgi:hypothetical protein
MPAIPEQDRGSSDKKPVHGGGPFAGVFGRADPATRDQSGQEVWGKTGPESRCRPSLTSRSATLTSHDDFR